jgi:Tfp pilus assembly protein PilF
MKYKTILALLGVVALVIMISVFVTDSSLFTKKNNNPSIISQKKAIGEVQKIFKKGGSHNKIYDILNNNSVTHSPSTFVLIESSRMYLGINKKKEALECLKKAWEIDQKNSHTILLLLNAFEGKTESRLKQIIPYLKTLPDNSVNEQFKASIFQDLKDGESARTIWTKLMDKNFSRLSSLKEYDIKRKQLHAIYNNQLAVLNKNKDKTDYSSKKYQLLKKFKKDNKALDNQYDTDVIDHKKEYNTAVAEYEKFACQIAESLLLNDQLDEAIKSLNDSLSKVETQSAKSLNLLFSLYLQNNDTEEADIVRKKLLTNGNNKEEVQLKEAILQIYDGNIETAKKNLEKNIQNSSKPNISTLSTSYNGRMYLALLRLFIDKENASFNDLLSRAYEDLYHLDKDKETSDILHLYASNKIIEQEILFYKTLTEMIQKPDEAIKILKKNNHLLPNHPVVDYLVIKASRVNNELVSSIDRINKVARSSGKLANIEGLHALFFNSPVISVEIAESLYQLGSIDKAQKILDAQHKRDKFTDESLNLYMRIAASQGQYDDILILADSLNKSSAPSELKEKMAVFLVSNNILNNNTDLISKLSVKADKTQALPIKIMALANNGKFEKAIELTEGLSKDPYYSNLIKGKLYYMSGKYTLAEKFFKKSLNKTNDFFGYREYADFLLNRNRLEESRKIYDEIIKAKPEDIPSILGLAAISEQANKLGDALKILKSNFKLNNPEISLKAAKIYLKEENYPSAILLADKVLQSVGRNNDALFIKVIAMVSVYNDLPSDQNKKILLSMKSYIEKENLQFNPASIALIEIENCLKNYQKVIELSKKYLKTNPKNAFLTEKYLSASIYEGDLVNAGKTLADSGSVLDKLTKANIESELLLAEGKTDKAVECLLNTSNRNLTLKAALILVKQGSIHKAKNLVQSINPTCYDWLSLADEANRNDLEKSVDFFELALKKSPDNPVVLNNYAWTITENNLASANKALLMAEKAYSILPTKDTLDTLIYVLSKKDNVDKCIILINSVPPTFTIKNTTIIRYLTLLSSTGNAQTAIKFITFILSNRRYSLSNNFKNQLKEKKEELKNDEKNK